ncbi:uncharacterized protein TrAtP1_006867 [Trichoderma atroviride]|uniref:uncharacterized protein n=1 Tax=Hypocrea atroviridis TaxID=63577 RepID=UPI00331D6EEB|nr:hypothetical protein TrAtP1_006867 [Trichoderma atroviride]
MSSALAKDASAQAADSKPKAAIAAVPTFNNALSKGASFGRVAVLLGLLAAQFNELVAQPALTLQSAVPVVAVVQVAYVVLCLPAAGSQQAKAAKKPRPGEKKKPEAAGSSSLVTALLALVLTTISTPRYPRPLHPLRRAAPRPRSGNVPLRRSLRPPWSLPHHLRSRSG